MDVLLKVLALIPFYLLGAFPTGLLISRAYGVDIAKSGSGNVGATNVARTIGKKLGLLTLVIDAFKGYLATWLAFLFTASPYYSAWAGVASIFGHCFSIPGKLRGGKGVATSLGVILCIDPIAAAFCIVIFLAMLFIGNLVSLASLVAVLSAPLVTMLRDTEDFEIAALSVAAALITYRHKDNLRRLIRGEETKFRN